MRTELEESAFFKNTSPPQKPVIGAFDKTDNTEQNTLNSTRKSTEEVAPSRGNPRDFASENPRGLLSRDEVQEFNFRLRDALKVKVQAEVPHEWKDELENIARQLDVKKLELYRFIIGEFLGRVQRKGRDGYDAH
jgi:hypothetical protein